MLLLTSENFYHENSCDTKFHDLTELCEEKSLLAYFLMHSLVVLFGTC